MAISDPEARQLVRDESAILAGLQELDRAEQDGSAITTTLETETVHVPAYGGRPGFSFPVRRLEPEGYDMLEKRHTKAGRPGEPATFRRQDYLCDIIIEASTEDVQAALWRNTSRQQRYGCSTPIDLVRKLIPKAGWREAICFKVDELGGWRAGQRVAFGSAALAEANDALEERLGN